MLAAMKINVLRNLVLPWILLFTLALSGAVVAGVQYHIQAKDHPAYFISIGLGILLSLVSNINTLSTAGIWITHSLPSSLKYNSWPWIFSALKATLLAGFIYLIGQMPFVPLFWQAFVIPIVFTLAVFVIVWRLMGPILTWSSSLSLSRMAAWTLSLPVFSLVPLTAIFLGQTIVGAYFSSRPELVMMEAHAPSVTIAKALLEEKVKESLPPVIEKRVESLKALTVSGKSCNEDSKLIQAALDPKAPEEVAYWGIKALKCAEMKSVVALPRLVSLMMSHSSIKVRVAAIEAMPRFGSENVKRIAYLLYKRINENNPPEVIQATAHVLTGLGETEMKSTSHRLKALLDSKVAGSAAADILVNQLKQDDLVAEYVVQNLSGTAETRDRAVSMICQLPPKLRTMAEPFIDQVVASVKTGSEKDPAMKALGCLGKSGFEAIQQEVLRPQKLERSIAARALSEMDVKDSPGALETAGNCVRDKNDQVRNFCSHSLGKIGVPALPKILDLLKSNDSTMKDAGKTALGFLNDPLAKPELERIRAENSGWMANQKKLQIAKAIDTALIKIDTEAQR